MVIPYQTTKFKSANMFAMAIWDPTAKFNSRQYFRLYGTEDAILLWISQVHKMHYTIIVQA